MVHCAGGFVLCHRLRVIYSYAAVPDTLKKSILQQLHSHLGVHKILAKTKESFYWPGYELNVTNWVHEAQSARKETSHIQHSKLHLPFKKLS